MEYPDTKYTYIEAIQWLEKETGMTVLKEKDVPQTKEELEKRSFREALEWVNNIYRRNFAGSPAEAVLEFRGIEAHIIENLKSVLHLTCSISLSRNLIDCTRAKSQSNEMGTCTIVRL